MDSVFDSHGVSIMVDQNRRAGREPGATQCDVQFPDLDERERVLAAIEHAGWVQARAARLLGMTPRQIAYRIQQFNITVRKI